MVDTSATGAVTAKAASANVQGAVYGASVNVQTSGALDVQQNIAARDRISLSSGGQLTNNGVIEAGVNADSTRNTTGDVSLTAQNLNNNGKSVIASRNLTANVAQTLNNQGGTLSAGQASTVKAGTLDNRNNGRVLSSNTLSVSADTLLNTQGTVSSNGNLTANIGQLNNHDGEVSSAATTRLIGSTLDNSDGLLTGDVALNIGLIGALNNRNGVLGSGAMLTVTAASLDNRAGKILSAKDMQLTIADLDNRQQGLLSSQAGLRVDGAQLNNAGGLLTAVGPVHLETTGVDNSGGRISSKTDLTANVAQLTNQGGELVAQGLLTVSGQSLDNRNGGLVGATKALKIDVDAVDNRGGEISSSVGIDIDGQRLDNSDNGKVLAGTDLGLKVAEIINQTKGLLFSTGTTTVVGKSLDNSGGSLVARQGLDIRLDNALTNVAGLISSEGTLTANVASLDNTQGSVSSGGALSLTLDDALLNQGGEILTDAGLTVKSASLDNRNNGTISGKQDVLVETGAFDNSQFGRLSSAANLDLTTQKLTNQDGGRIASNGALTASVTNLDQQGGQLFSNTALTLDLNQGQLNNQGGLINAPLLMLKHLAGVNNDGGEISSAQAFTLTAQSLDNDNGKLLSNQALTLRIDNALTNLKGLIAAAALDVEAASLNNNGGTLTSRANLDLALGGQLSNQSNGLISATDALTITTSGLNNQQGSLLGSAIAIDFGAATGDLDNSAGLITTAGMLSLKHLRDLNNQHGEISTSQSLDLNVRDLDNSAGQLISNGVLTVGARDVINQGGLLSGFKGLGLTATSLDNRNSGTLSSRDEDVSVTLSGALLNGNAGALVGKKQLTVSAASLDNSGGILSSGGDQTLTVSGGLLNNAQGGLIDSGNALVINAMTLGNAGGTINAQNALTFTGTGLDNTGGQLIGNAAVTLDLLGALTNTNGKLASAGPLRVERATQIANQGGQIASQGLLTLLTAGLDNRNRGTVAANDQLVLTSTGTVQNDADGLIYSQNGGVQIDAASLSNGKGTVQSQGAMTLTVANDLDNQSGRLQAKAGDLMVVARNLDNRGGVLASLQGLLTTQLSGVLKNGYDLNNNRQGGITQAQRLNLIALGGLDNYGGRISAQTGDASVTTRNFDNRNGGLYAKGKVSVTANDFDNSGDNDGQIAGSQIDLDLTGALNNRLGIIESDSTLAIKAASLDNQTGQLRALGSSGKTEFQIGGLFDNRNGTLETANSDLSLDVGSLLSTGGTVLHAGSGNFGISSNNVINAGGSFVTGGAMTLNADSWVNSSVLQADTLNINVNTFTQTATGQLLATTSLIGTGGRWTNDGLIASDGSLSLTLGGSYSGNGRVSSLGTLDMNVAGLSLAADASIAGGGDTMVAVGGQLSNAGRITSAAKMLVSAGTINNLGTLAGAQQLSLTTGSLVNDHGLVFSGGNMQLLTPRLTNLYGQVYSLGSTLIARDENGTMADLLDNRSGGIDSTGDLTIAATTVNNVMDVLQYTEHEKSQATITRLSCTLISYGCDDRGGGRINALWEVAETDRLTITRNSEAASINSGAKLSITATDVNNTSSVITAAGDLVVHASTINNKGLQEQIIETTRRYVSWVNETASAIRMADIFIQRNDPTPSATVEQDLSNFLAWMGQTLPSSSQVIEGRSLDAIIQAGGNVTLDATQNINNSVVRPYYAYVGAGSVNVDTRAGSAYSTPIYINAQLPPNLAQQQVNPVALPGFNLPTGQNGLFRLSGQDGSAPASSGPQSWTLGTASISSAQRQQTLPTDQASSLDTSTSGATVTGTLPGRSADFTLSRVQGLPISTVAANPHKYLIETNPVLTDLKSFMSSDYLLQNLGYDPDQSAKRLGDGLYEQTLIQQAVVARTGQRFIDGQTSNEDMFKYLMNNAIASKQELNLSLGVSLSSEQVAALTHDIVWMENAEVNGEQVLVPVLYLANANNRLAANGALIQGRDVSLIAGKDLNNVGTLKASNNLSAAAGETLANSGLMQSADRLDLLAGTNVINRAGGIITGRDVSATAILGDVVNERTVTTHQSTSGFRSERTSFIDSAARIEAANDLSFSAGRDINNIGGALQSGRDLLLNAGSDVNLVAAQTIDNELHGTNRNNSTTTQYSASVTAGRDLSAKADNNINVIASQIDAKRDIDMAATENVTISSAADEQHFLYKSKKLTMQEDHVSQVKSEINAGGSIDLNAKKNLTMVSSRITAGDEAYLAAGEKLQLLAAQNSDYSLFDEKKKGGWGSKKTQRDEVTDVKNIGSEITTGGDLTLKSGDDQRYQVAKLESGKDITLDSGGAITFEGVKDLHKEDHAKSDSSMAWSSMSGKGNTDETLRQTQMVAAGAITIKAVDGLNIDLKQVNQESVHQSIKAMVDADPQLAWLAEAEKRGDVDWRQVKEVHDSYKYSHSGMGPAVQMIVAILVVYFTAGAASGLIGTMAGSGAVAGSGTAFAAAGTATASAVAGGAAVGSTVAAGWANVALTAIATGAASNATISFINNGGDLGAVFKDVTSTDALRGYVVSGVTAGLTASIFDKMTNTTTTVEGALPNAGKVVATGGLSSLEGIGRFGANQLLQNGTSTLLDRALGGDSQFDDALRSSLANTFAAAGFNLVGDIGEKYNLKEGGLAKVGLHAVMGGLAAEAAGGDFKTGALAAGVNELLVDTLAQQYTKMTKDQKNKLLVMNSQLIGILAAAAGGDAADLQIGSWVAQSGTQYNRQLHYEEQKWLEENAKVFAQKEGITEQAAMERLSQQALKSTDYLWRSLLSDGDDNAALAFLSGAGKTFVNDLGETQALFTASGQQLFRPEMFADTADPAFYKKFVQSGISRDLSSGLTKELKDSGIAVKDGAINLYDAVRENPKAVMGGLWEGVKGLPQSVVDSFHESGNAIGEGAAVALDSELTAKLNAIYGTDVSTAQQALLFIRTASAITMAGTGGKVGGKLTGAAAEAVGKKLDEILAEAAEKKLLKNGEVADEALAGNPNVGDKGPCCFAAGTMVSTPEGDRAIETLKVGEMVWSKPEKGGKPFAATILATHQRSDQAIYRLKLKSLRNDSNAGGETLLVTSSHPFYVPAKRDFIPVIDLKPGDLLQSLTDGDTENTSSEVESLELYLPVGNTYNLTVDIGHTFYVGELKTWVHNTGPCPLPEKVGDGAKEIPKELGKVSFDAANGVGTIYSPRVTMSGSEITFDEFAIGTSKGFIGVGADGAAELAGPLKKMLAYAQSQGAEKITLTGRYASPEGSKLGTGSFDSVNQNFSFSFPATKEGLRDFLKGVGQ
ncbi:polymorphic toxin-type HINT domain-containing protein [Pseudomonas mediterranea]|uniref:polymorphic toxin-type HINT domain-containing protein n=1 Tax=Pseudomonas mediterranea TaxID=183795 RepID=UPI0006D88EBC